MKVLMVEPEKMAYEAIIGDDLKSMQSVVGGDIEAVYPYNEPVAIVCNGEGKLEHLPFNRALRDEEGKIYDVIAGKFFICGLGKENFVSLPPELMEKFKGKFQEPEVFAFINGHVYSKKVSEQYIETQKRVKERSEHER